MKDWTKKALALALCLVMLAAMIPAGLFTASALDYSKSEFEIANLNDWNDVASSSESFAGKTVKLTADIDARGATLATLFDTFAGTFDGQGHTVSNFTVTNTARGLIATTTTAGAVIKNVTVNGTMTYTDDGYGVGMLIGNHDGTGSLTVSDVTVSGTLRSRTMQVGGVVGVLSLKDGATATLNNINVDASVTSTRATTTHGAISAGGVIGTFEPLGRCSLSVRNVNMSGTVTSSRTAVGGIIGSVFSSDSSEELYTGGTITVANCHMTGTLSTAATNPSTTIGGIVGNFGGFKRDYGEYCAFDGELTIENCVIGGSIANTNGLTNQISAVGGVLGSASYGHATVNVEHCLITASFPSNSLTSTNGMGAGVILGASFAQTMFALNVNNTVTTASAFNMINASILAEGKNAVWMNLNGKNLANETYEQTFLLDSSENMLWRYAAAFSDSSVTTVSAEAASSMLKKDEAGYLKRVGGQITALAVQDNVADNAILTTSDKYAIRFIGVSHVESVASASMTVIVRDAATGTAFKRYVSECNLYDGLNAYDVGGAKLAYYNASDFGAKKFLALTIGNIPGGEAYTFDFTPSYTTEDGLTVTAETVSVTYDQNGQYVYEKASFDVAPLVTMPTVRVMSSNIMNVDNAMYNLDNKRNDTGEVYDPALDKGKSDTTIYKNGQTYYWYFRDDIEGEYLGRIDGVAGTGFSHEERIANMAKAYLFYEPDFIGLQEIFGVTAINGHATINMYETLLSCMSTKYAYVDVSSKAAPSEHYVPIMYLKDRWTVVASNVDSVGCCETHRWTWALFQSIENPNVTVIVLNMHAPTAAHGATLGGKDIFFGSVNAELKKLKQLYPNATITVTGDYNESADSTHLATMIAGTEIQNSSILTENNEATLVDHIFVDGALGKVQQFRVVNNLSEIQRSSDHRPVYADILVTPTPNKGNGSSMDWEDGMTIYEINSNTNVIKVLGERHLASNETLYADWTASGLEFYANMNSTSDIVFTANSTAPVYFKAYVDGALWQNNGSDYYTVSGASKITLKDVPAGTHTVRLVKATGYLLGQAEISAVELNGTISATPDKDLYIEFLGDSISCGWGVVGSHDGGYKSQDGTLAYPYLVAQAMNADYSILGLSGRGVVHGTDYNFDKNYLQASPARSTSAYGFERQADIVVINLGTNDRGHHADTAEFEAGYLRLLENVFAKNGSDCVVYCLWGVMNDTYNTQIQSAIATYLSQHANATIYTLELPKATFTEAAGHPSADEGAAYATTLEAYINETYVNP